MTGIFIINTGIIAILIGPLLPAITRKSRLTRPNLLTSKTRLHLNVIRVFHLVQMIR
jgi:hypothetical protein